MPQLDKTIIFTQIFWSFFMFTFFYAVLTHYFLPKILKSLKSRKLVVLRNSKEIDNLSIRFEKKQFALNQTLLKSLVKLENLISDKFFLKNSANTDSVLSIVDEKMSLVCKSFILYCDSHILRSISFRLQ